MTDADKTNCPSCGQPNEAVAEYCWACYKPLRAIPVSSSRIEPKALPAEGAETSSGKGTKSPSGGAQFAVVWYCLAGYMTVLFWVLERHMENPYGVSRELGVMGGLVALAALCSAARLRVVPVLATLLPAVVIGLLYRTGVPDIGGLVAPVAVLLSVPVIVAWTYRDHFAGSAWPVTEAAGRAADELDAMLRTPRWLALVFLAMGVGLTSAGIAVFIHSQTALDPLTTTRETRMHLRYLGVGLLLCGAIFAAACLRFVDPRDLRGLGSKIR
jgi:hypothetical protein